MTPKMQRGVSVGVAGVGLVLLVLMVTTEGEPGALPLGLLLLGTLGYVGGRWRERQARRAFDTFRK